MCKFECAHIQICTYCAERVWLAAVTAQQSQMIKKNSLLFCCPKIMISWGVNETTPKLFKLIKIN